MPDKKPDLTSDKDNKSTPKTKLEKPKGTQTIINPNYDQKPDTEAIVPFGNTVNESKALTALQRLHRAQVIRRIQPKLKMARERAQSRRADDKKIAVRAMRQARDIARTRVAGNSGRKYEELSAGEKIQIDKRLETKVGLIRRIAKRLIPVVRKAESVRFAAHSHKSMTNTDNLPHTKMVVKTNEAFDHLDGAVDDKHTSRYKQKIVVGKDGKRRIVTTAVRIKSVEEGLAKKSEKHGIPLEALHEVFDRGMADYDASRHGKLTADQYAYGRVNKFVADQSIDEDVATRFKMNWKERGLNEEIKGWKNAHADIAGHRAALGKSVKTHRLKKDGTKNKMSDAVKLHRNADEARAYVNAFKKNNPQFGDKTHEITDLATGEILK